MCGRYTLTVPGEDLAELFELSETPELAPRYNIAPTQSVAAVRLDKTGERRLSLLHWGLIPFWAKDPKIGNRMINARSETAAEKPAYRAAFERRRCLVAADGFYEWMKTDDGSKRPHFIHLKGGKPFAIAGLWERWRDDDRKIDSCTLLTTRPNPLVGPIHDRMPVILPKSAHALWLDREVSDRERLEELLVPYPADEMEAYPVSRFVNRPANDSPRCVEPAL